MDVTFFRLWYTSEGNMEWEFIFDLYSDPTANIWISPHHMFYFHGVWTNQTLTKKLSCPISHKNINPLMNEFYDEFIISFCPLFVCSFHASIFSASVKTLYLFLFYLFNKVTTLVINYDVIPPS